MGHDGVLGGLQPHALGQQQGSYRSVAGACTTGSVSLLFSVVAAIHPLHHQLSPTLPHSLPGHPSPLQVITKEIDGVKVEPYEEAVVEVPENYVGSVVELFAQRKGEMTDMQPSVEVRQGLWHRVGGDGVGRLTIFSGTADGGWHGWMGRGLLGLATESRLE